MAAIEITVSGVLYDKYARTTRPVVLIGDASLTGLGIGGGPIIPPGNEGGPPGIWGGGNVPMPNPPIANVPGAPGYDPPHPAHPIVIPDPPPDPPADVAWEWGWHPQYGWHPVYVPGDKPQPVP